MTTDHEASFEGRLPHPLPPTPADEGARLQALHELKILDTPPDEVLDSLAEEARAVCQAPISLVTLVDRDRQWFKARRGMNLIETPRDVSFCAHAIARPVESAAPFVVADAAEDERFSTNPLVVDEPNIRSYAGAPIRTKAGHALGTLCVLDHVPRELTPAQLAALTMLSSEAASVIELRRLLADLVDIADEQVRAAAVLGDAEAVLREAITRGHLLRTVVFDEAPGPAAPTGTASLVAAIERAGVRAHVTGSLPSTVPATAVAALSSCAADLAALPDVARQGVFVEIHHDPDDVLLKLAVPARRSLPDGLVRDWRRRMAAVRGWAGISSEQPLTLELWLPAPVGPAGGR